MTSPPPSLPPPIPPAAAKGSLPPGTRKAELERELAAASEQAHRALLDFELGHLLEIGLGQNAQAAQHYLQAHNADHDFRLSLYALLRLFERRGAHPNLPRLYQAQAKHTRTATEKAAALLDEGLSRYLQSGDRGDLIGHAVEALSQDGGSLEAAALLEGLGGPDLEPALVRQVLQTRARHADDSEVRALAMVELSQRLLDEGQVDEARTLALSAAREAPGLERAHVHACRLLRQVGPIEQLVESLEGHARLVQSRWPADAQPDDPEAGAHAAAAAALWCEAARLSAGALFAPGDALECLKEAAALRPSDTWIRQLRMFAYDLLEDREGAAREARALLEQGATGRHAAGLHFRVAELALVEGDMQAARERLLQAIESSGGSVAAAAMLDDLLFDAGLHDARLKALDDLEANPATALQAALIAAHELGDAERARPWFARAAADPSLRDTALREAYFAALQLGDDGGLQTALDGLLELELSPDERAALVHQRATAPDASDQTLAAHLDDPACADWLPQLARLRAAGSGNWPLLARAHQVLADRSDNPESRAAHLCAAARALLRVPDGEAAAAALRQALELSPTHPYALALLQEALRASGHEHDVVELLLQTAERQKTDADTELSLLLAGAAAEAAGELERAARTYEEAAERSPASVGPLWALWRLAQRTGDLPLEQRARAGLSRLEVTAGTAGHETLLLAQHLDDLADTPELAEPELERVLGHEALAPYAAVDLLLLRGADASTRVAALETLCRVDPEAAVPYRRELAGWLGAQPELAELHARLVEELLGRTPEDRAALWARHERAVLQRAPTNAASALEQLAAPLTDAALRQDLRAEALRLRRWTRADAAELAADLDASGLGDPTGWTGSVARSLLEELGPLEEPKLRARAYALRAEAAEGADCTAQRRGLAQASLAAGDALHAAEVLEALVRDDPDDLASWELLRVAARAANRPEWTVRACDRLAPLVQGELWAQLSEEAAALRMDQLGEDAEAERIFRAVLEQHPARPIAFGRLHDLLSERDDSAGLLQLLTQRIAAIDDADELVKLFYEQARIHRAEGDFGGALDALDNLLMLDDEHVAGLALAAEIHTARGNWQDAVEALRSLAQTDIPGAQRKLARLGAADYLQHKLGKPDEALDELLTIETEGLAGPAVYARMADLHEAAGELDKCVRALRAAAGEARGAKRAVPLRRAALLLEREGQPGQARALHEEVLSILPTDLESTRSLANLIPEGSERSEALRRFEAAVLDELFRDGQEPEPYRKLAASAHLRGDTDLAFRATSAMLALGLADAGERATLERDGSSSAVDPGATLSDAELAALLTPATDPSYRRMTLPLMRAAAELDRLSPARFGVGRAERVSPREAHGLRDQVRDMLVALGGELADFYVGGSSPTLVAAAPKGLATHVIVGVGVTTPLSPMRRHDLAAHIAAARLGCLPMMQRGPEATAQLFHAALLAAERPLSPAIDRDALGDLPRELWKAAARRDRKALLEAAAELDDGGLGALPHVQRLTQHVRRVALLLAGDVVAALGQLFGRAVGAEEALAHEEAKDLIRAWLSPEMGELRRKLGVAV